MQHRAVSVACFVSASLAFAFPTVTPAHPGGLDVNGCHHNRRTGDYHCHRAPRAIPPSAPSSRSNEPSDSARACGSKRYCGQMTSCDEAMFYFLRCGVTRLDGDGDGVPCEKLCRRR
jgi:hypothetical protein